MARFRKLPVVIDAVRWSGSNWHEVLELETQRPPRVFIAEQNDLYIETLEGRMRADVGDYVIRGVSGELYPCKPDIFKATYEPA